MPNMSAIIQDVRYAVRVLGRNKGFTAVAVLALALGIGANTAIFSVINGILLKPLPYPEPERLVRVFESNPAAGFPRFPMNMGNFVDYRRMNDVFSDIALYTLDELLLGDGEHSERLATMRVSGRFFEALGFQAAIGRILSGRTSFVIAHRLSTIRSADMIMVVDHGEIVERGTHRELLQRGGQYRDLYLMQYRRERRAHGETVEVLESAGVD